MSLESLQIEVVGAGRMGRALVAALRHSGLDVPPPGLRGARGEDAELVILAVTDAEIGAAAAAIEPGRVVAHLSGATTLEPLRPHERFGLHPLMTISGAEGDTPARFEGVYSAISASSERAQQIAVGLAERLGMVPFMIRDEDRPAYHAAASIASNYLVTLEACAERLASSVGVPREALVPLVTATVQNWALQGAERALTGPIARGDEATVERQRAAVAVHLPEQLELFDALALATRQLADRAQHVPGEMM
ncbi:MAG: DUF2520 domain-containing protein [Leucobacter sp.]|nr:DUF2520 domain-containing protein [Leucobacter sp.]